MGRGMGVTPEADNSALLMTFMSPHETGSAVPMQEGAAVEGRCDPGFAPVRDAFLGNFGDRGEVGGAVCVMVDGAVVADLRGGWADPDRGRRWRPPFRSGQMRSGQW